MDKKKKANPFSPTKIELKKPVPADIDIARSATLKPISKICKEADISYKLREGTYIRGVGAEYEKVIPLVFNTRLLF